MESSKKMFEMWASGSEQEIGTLPLTTLEALAQFVKSSGFQPLPTRCPVLARKFPIDTKLAVAMSLLDCKGAGLSLQCDHPKSGGA